MSMVQFVSLVRMVLIFGGGLAVGQGWITKENVEAATDPAMLSQVIGGVVAIGTAAWGLWRRRPTGIIEDAGTLKEVAVIKADKKIADAIPNTKVQPRR